MMQRHKFAKGYVTHRGSTYIRIEESYAGDNLEIQIGDEDFECDCEPCSECTNECNAKSDFTISLPKAEIKELIFCLNQFHFIDQEKT